MFNHLDFFGLVLTIILGLGWGGFATSAICRIPNGLPWIGDKPRCLLCKHELNIIDYCSLFSHFFLRGKCRYCNQKYESSIEYFLTELFIPIGLVLCYMKYGFGDMFVMVSFTIIACVIIAVIDATYKKIPAKILITTLILGIIYRMFHDKGFYGALYGGMIAAIFWFDNEAYLLLHKRTKTYRK